MGRHDTAWAIMQRQRKESTQVGVDDDFRMRELLLQPSEPERL